MRRQLYQFFQLLSPARGLTVLFPPLSIFLLPQGQMRLHPVPMVASLAPLVQSPYACHTVSCLEHLLSALPIRDSLQTVI